MYIFFVEITVKLTVSEILSDLPWKNGNARFTSVSLKALTDQV